MCLPNRNRSLAAALWVLAVVAVLGVFSAARAHAITTSSVVGLVGWWDGEGNAQDSAGNNHGTAVAGAAYAPAIAGSGFSFDGIDDRVEIPDAENLKLTGSLSLSAWIFPRSVPGSNRRAQIFFRGDNRNGFDPYSIFLFEGQVGFLIESQVASSFLLEPIAPGRFYHIAATLDDATGLMRLYVNGAVVAETTTSIRPLRELEPAWHPALSIGNVPDFENSPHIQPFNGTIDEVKIYSRARTAAEVREEYEAGVSRLLVVSGFESARVARFKADTGALVDTVAGNGLDHPSGLAFGPDGNLYVGSHANDRVLRYRGATGEYLDTFVTAGSGGLDGPEGLVFGPDGNLYVASRATNQVLRFHGQSGAFLGVFAAGGGLSAPFDLTFGPDCNLYVSSRGNASVQRYDGVTGAWLGAFVPAGAGGLQIDEPRGITFGPDDQLYVAAHHTGRVLRFDGASGSYLGALVAAGAGGLRQPTGLRFGPEGHLYVSSASTHDVKRFHGSTGQFQQVFAAGGDLLQATFLTFSRAVLPNRAPIAQAGSDVQRAWQGAPVQVQLDGSRSCDLDAEPLTFEWREGNTLLGTSAVLSASFGFGVHHVILAVRDPQGAVGMDEVVVAIVATSAPADLRAAAVSGTEVRLSWRDQSAIEDGFLIERRQGAGMFAQIDTADAAVGEGSTVHYADTAGLSANQTYVYRVRATSPAGVSDYSNEASVSTNPLPPTAPAHLTLSATSPTAIQLTWTDTSLNETGFGVERKSGAGGFAYIGTAAADTSTFPDPGLSADTTYTYRIRALGTGGDSGFSNEATLPTPPLAPTGLAVSAPAPDQLLLTWTDTSQTESGFRIERRVGDFFTQVGTVGAGVTQFVDTGVLPGTSYTYQLRSTNAGGASAPSGTVTGLSLPATPTQFAVAPFSATQLELSWTDGNPSPLPVKVERSSSGGSFAQVAVSPGGSTTFRDSGLTALTTYTYRIRATNASGDSGYSGTASARTYPAPPAAPGSLTAQALSSRSVQLIWLDNSTTESGFEVMRRGPGSGQYQLIATAAANAGGYLDATGLSGSTSYSYQVRAVNAGGGSSYTAAVTVVTPPELPSPPTGVSAVAVSSTVIQVTWLDASDNETGFRVERKESGGGFTLLAVAPAGDTEYFDAGRAESTPYTYRVLAQNAQGSSAPSGEVTATTLPHTPSHLTATAGNRKIDLTWIDHSAHETGFRIERKAGTNDFGLLVTVAAGVTVYSDTTTTAGTQYTYRVSATSTSGVSVPSNESSATPRNETPLAKLVIAPQSLSFGAVKRGKTGKKTIKLTNKGKEAVTGTVGSVSAPFAQTSGGGAFTLGPKQSRTVVLTFTPSATSLATSKLRITSTDPKAATVDVTLSGKGR